MVLFQTFNREAWAELIQEFFDTADHVLISYVRPGKQADALI